MKKLLLSVALVVLFTPLAHAKRVALVVGNASYVHERKLKNPINDARLLEATFKNKPLAFDQVIYLQDANRAELLKGLARFKQAAQGAELAVVYYSGHGMSNSRRSNYLLPVDMPAIASDASLDVDVALKTSAVSEDELIEAIEDAKVQVVILDACRDNGFLPKSKSGSKGLGRTEVGYTDRLLAYATEAGRTAEDGKGSNSTYAASLAKNLRRTELSLLAALDQVADDVVEATLGAQRPTRSGSLRTGVFIVPGVSGGVLTRDQVLFAQLSSRLARGDSKALAELEALPLYQEMRKKLGLSGPLRAPEASRGSTVYGSADGKADAQMSPDRQTIAQVVIQSQSSDATERALAEAMAIYLQDRSNRKSKLQELAERGNDMAAMMLERTLRMGLSGPADRAGAARWKAQTERAQSALELLEQQSNPLILSWLGNKYRDSENRIDWPKAVAYFERAAAMGYPYAHLVLGSLHQEGKGVAKDEVLAANWYRKSAEGGNPDGMLSFGNYLRGGRGVGKDEAQAVSWYRKAAEAGSGDGMHNLGWMLQKGVGVVKDEAQAASWFRKAAEAGSLSGMFALGSALQNGKGVAKDEAQAVNWYRKAADLGNKKAMLSLGFAFENGKGTTKDETQAVTWYRKAAEAGDASGMAYFANMLRDGKGVAKDEAQAVSWYRKAAEAGDASGMAYFGSSLQEGKGVEKDEAGGTRWIMKAAEMGDSYGMGLLGWSYDTGTGISKDKSMAAHWYQKAADAGNEWAKNQLESAASR